MGLLKSTASKVVTGVVALAVVVGGITWWQTPPETRQAFLTSTGRILAWLGVVLVVPWAGVLGVAWVARRDSNAAGFVLVGSLTLLEALLLAWMFDFAIFRAATATSWVFFLLGVGLAGAYNLLICDWLAERFQR